MEDSASNPYIPGESNQIRQQTETLTSPLGRIVKTASIITGAIAILVGIGLFFVIPRTVSSDSAAHVALGNVVQPPDQLAKLVPVVSTMGFSLQYDNRMFNSYAEMQPVDAAGKPSGPIVTYENNDLRTPHDYNMVRIRPIQSTDSSRSAITNPPELLITSAITQQTLKDNETKPDYKGMSRLNVFIRLAGDLRLAARNPADGTTATLTIDESKPVGQTINGVEYQMVRYTTKNDNYRIPTQKYDDCYYTIQNEVPYSACVTGIRPNNVDAAALDEQVMKSISFQAPTGSNKPKTDVAAKITDTPADPKKTADVAAEGDTSDTDTAKEAALVAQKPEYNQNPLSLKAVAKNQPSIVRIGTLYCADLALKMESGATGLSLTDACVGRVSTGTIVGKDGLIATTGHALRVNTKEAISGYINFAENKEDMLQRLQRVLDYLLKSKGLLLQSDADYLKIGAQIGDQEALAKIENIASIIPDNFVTAVKEEYTYAVQPSDKPIVLDRSTGIKPSFAYSDSVLKGTFVAADYDSTKAVQEAFGSETPSVDVGMLKVDGSFQNVPVVPGDGAKSKDNLNTIGFPAYTESALMIDKIRNTPVVTNSLVNQTYDKGNHKVIQTGTPIVPGNDGAGTFDQLGQYMGVAAYGLSYCPDQQCFANGTVRSSNELLGLLDKQNMKLGDLSPASTVWRSAIDEYFKGNYAVAESQFGQAGSQYGYNGYAEALQKLSHSKLGSKNDTSLMNQLTGLMIGVLITMVVLTIGLIAVYIFQRQRISQLRVGHYGGVAPQPTMQQPVLPQQPIQQMPPQQWNQPPQQPLPYPQQQPMQQPQYPVRPGTMPPVQPGAYPTQPVGPQQPPQYPSQQQPPAAPPPEDPFYQ